MDTGITARVRRLSGRAFSGRGTSGRARERGLIDERYERLITPDELRRLKPIR